MILTYLLLTMSLSFDPPTSLQPSVSLNVLTEDSVMLPYSDAASKTNRRIWTRRCRVEDSGRARREWHNRPINCGVASPAGLMAFALAAHVHQKENFRLRLHSPPSEVNWDVPIGQDQTLCALSSRCWLAYINIGHLTWLSIYDCVKWDKWHCRSVFAIA